MRVKFKGESRVWEADAVEGESLMQVAVKNGVEGIIGECGGEMSCATCHVYVAVPWSERLPPASLDERELLEMVDGLRDESRLSCQIRVSSRFDGIEVEVPKSS